MLPLVVVEFGALVEPRAQGAADGGEVPEESQQEALVLRAPAREALDRIELLAPPIILAGDEVAGRALPEPDDERRRLVRDVLGMPDLRVVCWEASTDRPEGGAHETVWGPRPADAARLAAEVRPHGEPGFLIVDGDADIVGWRPLGLQIVRLGPAPNSPLAALHRPDHDARDLRDAANWILLQDTFEGQVAL